MLRKSGSLPSGLLSILTFRVERLEYDHLRMSSGSRPVVTLGAVRGEGIGGPAAPALVGLTTADPKPKCREAGHPCEGNQQCCDGLVCIVSGPGKARRCAACPDGQVACRGSCVPTCAGGQTLNPATCACECPPAPRSSVSIPPAASSVVPTPKAARSASAARMGSRSATTASTAAAAETASTTERQYGLLRLVQRSPLRRLRRRSSWAARSGLLWPARLRSLCHPTL